MDKLLVICGATATGKTSLALKLAKSFDGELVSADSRQVYKGMDVGTGKGLPRDLKLKSESSKLGGYYNIDGAKLWGYDLVEPKKDFSVSQYSKFANAIIVDIHGRGKLPILVGGTGFYIKAVVDGIETALIPPNKALRKNLANKTVQELMETLASADPIKAASLNSSDRKNKRRLVRAIEVALSGIKPKPKPSNYNPLFIGLFFPKETQSAHIQNSVLKRVELGIEKEIDALLASGVKWKHQAMQALGYRQWEGYFSGEKKINEVVDNWTADEIKYTKRQMTWFKKDKRINWFDVSENGVLQKIEKIVESWHNG